MDAVKAALEISEAAFLSPNPHRHPVTSSRHSASLRVSGISGSIHALLWRGRALLTAADSRKSLKYYQSYKFYKGLTAYPHPAGSVPFPLIKDIVG